MRRRVAVLFAAVCMVPQAVSGQPISPGSRVRFTGAGEGTHTGTLVALTADTLLVRLVGRANPTRMPLARVTRLDVSLGKRYHTLSRTKMGFIVGFAVGAAAGALDPCEAGGTNCMSASDGAMLGGIVLGSLGAGIGLIAGLVPSEKWEGVPLERRRVGLVTPTRGHGAVVGLSLAF